MNLSPPFSTSGEFLTTITINHGLTISVTKYTRRAKRLPLRTRQVNIELQKKKDQKNCLKSKRTPRRTRERLERKADPRDTDSPLHLTPLPFAHFQSILFPSATHFDRPPSMQRDPKEVSGSVTDHKYILLPSIPSFNFLRFRQTPSIHVLSDNYARHDSMTRC